VVKYLKDGNDLISDLERDLNVESDCEGDSMGVVPATQKAEEKEEVTRAVLIPGSFSAYVRFLASR